MIHFVFQFYLLDSFIDEIKARKLERKLTDFQFYLLDSFVARVKKAVRGKKAFNSIY